LPVEDKSLLGGFQVFYQNKVIDSSLKGRLRHLKENLTA
jgi:F0F1-type ATP synthase delta subunit